MRSAVRQAVLSLVGTGLLVYACSASQPTGSFVRLSPQQVAPTPTPIADWSEYAFIAAAAREAECPGVLKGCHAVPPHCVPTFCFCFRVCAPATSVGRVWRRSAEECECAER